MVPFVSSSAFSFCWISSMRARLSQKRIKEIREAFAIFDKDGDGTISSQELCYVMRSLGMDPTERDLARWDVQFQFLELLSVLIYCVFRLMLAVDRDGSGKIEFQEFLDLMSENNEVSEEDIRDAFRLFDKDGNGTINKSEIKWASFKLHFKSTSATGMCPVQLSNGLKR